MNLIHILGLALLAALITWSPASAQGGSASSTNCNVSVVYDATSTGSTQLVPAPNNNRQLYICGYGFFSNGTANVQLVYGTTTSTPCDTGTVVLTPAYRFTAQTGFVDPSPYFRGMLVPSGNNLCISVSASVAVQAVVYYAAQ